MVGFALLFCLVTAAYFVALCWGAWARKPLLGGCIMLAIAVTPIALENSLGGGFFTAVLSIPALGMVGIGLLVAAGRLVWTKVAR